MQWHPRKKSPKIAERRAEVPPSRGNMDLVKHVHEVRLAALVAVARLVQLGPPWLGVLVLAFRSVEDVADAGVSKDTHGVRLGRVGRNGRAHGTGAPECVKRGALVDLQAATEGRRGSTVDMPVTFCRDKATPHTTHALRGTQT